MSNNKQSRFEDLEYWKNNAEENYMTTPISVLKYIHKLENHIETIKAQLPSDEELKKQFDVDEFDPYDLAYLGGAIRMRNLIQGGNNE